MNHLALVTSLKVSRNFPKIAGNFSEFYSDGVVDRLYNVTHSGEARGFKVGGGVKGRVREGVYPLPVGVRGLCPGKIFKLHMHAGDFKSNFHTNINTLTPVFMPLSFGKIFKLHMHAGDFKSNFHTNINTLTPVFMPLSFGKMFKLYMHAGDFKSNFHTTEKFSNYTCMQASLRAIFIQKSTH
jgi:hypothetical protein